jgi:anti-sigma factor RsiW
VFYWIDGPFGYALAGDIERSELQKIARGVYQQLNP